MKKKIILLLIFLVLAIFSLETLSRTRPCKNNCVVAHCSSLPGFSSPEVSFQNLSLLNDLKSKRNAGEEISKEEYRQTADKLILKVSPEKLNGCLNGQACVGLNIGYVRNDLPAEAEKFVKRHELEHLFQTGVKEKWEFLANLSAAKEYPVGLFETIFFSLKNRIKYQDSTLCYFLTTWETFKTYFLP